MQTYKIVLVGDKQVGKTSFIQRHRSGVFEASYMPTIGVQVHPIVFHTNVGPICFNVWDCAGNEKLGGLTRGYFCQADAAILMFDVANRESYENIDSWHTEFQKVCPDAPVILCGNKVDLLERVEEANQITDHKDHELKYYDVSGKSCHNFEKPFLELARQLGGNSELHFVKH